MKPRLSLLSAADAAAIVDDACRVLETVGVRVEHGEAGALLQAAGARVQRERLLLPEAAVRGALETVPRSFTLYDRDGNPAVAAGTGATAFDPGSAALYLVEPGTGTRREATTRDLVRLARLVDRLPAYGAQSTALVPADVPRAVADRHRLYVALCHGRKPVVTGTFAADGFAPMHEMLVRVRGGEAALRARPLAIFDCCPSPPLTWSALTADALVGCARAGVPATLVSMPLAGATAPVTLREAVVQHAAESLSGVLLHQAAGPGSPLVWGGCPAAFDMRHGTTPMGAAETLLLELGCTGVGRHLGLPVHGYLGLSDAKIPDWQGGMETGMGALLAVLAGVDLASGPGALDFILSQSLEKILLDHEACAQALRVGAGLGRREADLGGLFTDLVAAGTLLGHAHTRRHWRGELTRPGPVLDRAPHGDPGRGGADAWGRAAVEVERLLATSDPAPLAPEVAADLRGIMRREVRRHGGEGLPEEGVGTPS